MKLHQITILAITSLFILFSCSKKKDSKPIAKVYPEENFWDSMIMKGGYSYDSNHNSRMGHLIKFKAKANGTINSFVVRQPKAGFVSIWVKKNTFNGSIYEASFNTSTANTDFIKTITPIELQKDSFYYLIFSSNSSFKYDKTNTISPINSGNIEIIGNDWGVSADGGSGLGYFNNFFQPTFSNILYGNVSFNFQRKD